MVETGMRPSEACNLLPGQIRLSADVPHVAIQEIEGVDGARAIKSVNAERTIPLVGCALMAMKAFPNGFPYYHDKEDALSALLNKAFRVRDLLKVPGQTLYSLRPRVQGPPDRLARHKRFLHRYDDGTRATGPEVWEGLHLRLHALRVGEDLVQAAGCTVP
jgi:hypothetical protein